MSAHTHTYMRVWISSFKRSTLSSGQVSEVHYLKSVIKLYLDTIGTY